MRVLEGLEPKRVMYYFEEITKIPHGSFHVEKLSDYLVAFAKEHGLAYRQDESLNVIIWKDGSKGYEEKAPVIIQGHMDMVAVKTPECSKNMDTDGLDVMVEGDWISADGTSLGGDDGIAVAYGLALLEADSIAHPPLEVVITTEEEVGLLGATALDASDLKGRRMLNIDSEDEGIFTVSCAGGAEFIGHFPIKREEAPAITMLEIALSGFTGGHSGVEIGIGRANAIVAMGRILSGVAKEAKVQLIGIDGGEKDNAIAVNCTAKLSVAEENVEAVVKTAETIFVQIKEEYSTTDQNAECQIRTCAEAESLAPMSEDDTRKAIALLNVLPYGVQRMNPSIEGLVQTSLNLGIIKTEAEEVKFTYAVRSSNENEKYHLMDQLSMAFELAGGEGVIESSYPGWDYNPNSALRDVMVEEYEKLYGEKPVVEGIHAGLECGIFCAKMEGLDAISFGPQMHDIHTTREKLSVSSVERTWKLLLNTLKSL